MSVAERVVPPARAEMEDEVREATGKVVIGNVAVVDPAGTVTDVGTVATAVRVLLRVTTTPPAGAG